MPNKIEVLNNTDAMIDGDVRPIDDLMDIGNSPVYGSADVNEHDVYYRQPDAPTPLSKEVGSRAVQAAAVVRERDFREVQYKDN